MKQVPKKIQRVLPPRGERFDVPSPQIWEAARLSSSVPVALAPHAPVASVGPGAVSDSRTAFARYVPLASAVEPPPMPVPGAAKGKMMAVEVVGLAVASIETARRTEVETGRGVLPRCLTAMVVMRQSS